MLSVAKRLALAVGLIAMLTAAGRSKPPLMTVVYDPLPVAFIEDADETSQKPAKPRR